MGSLLSFFETTPSAQLGPWERQVLQAVWERRTATVRELLEDGKISANLSHHYDHMDRLFKKGLLLRTPDGKAFRVNSTILKFSELKRFRRLDFA